MNEHYDHFAGWMGGLLTIYFGGISATAADIGLKVITAGVAVIVGITTARYNIAKKREIDENRNKNKKDD